MIRSADRIPAQRDTLYNRLAVHHTPADDPTAYYSVGSTTGRSFSGTGTRPHSGQTIIGIGVPQ